MKKVNVLLSSYNGEKYIREQINSILSQTYSNIELFVRDDGSTDSTPIILQEYADKGQLTFIKGNNLGFIKSFITLIDICNESDYYAFSDQDDIWFPEKIEKAIYIMESTNHDKPFLYFCNYANYDKEMNFVSNNHVSKYNLSFLNSVVDCAPLGFCSVFNHAARKQITQNIPQKSCGHDWWLYMLCSAYGKVFFDNKPLVKYRKHGKNVSFGAGKGFLSFQIWRFKKFFSNNYFHNIREQVQEFTDYYYDSLSNENKKILDLFTFKKISVKKQLEKIFYPHKMRQKLIDEIFLRIIFLIGKL